MLQTDTWELIELECSKAEIPSDGYSLEALAILVEMEEDEKAERQRQRLLDCGRPACRFDPHTGGYIWFTYNCGRTRECMRCATMRAERHKIQMTNYLQNGKRVFALRMHSSKAKSLARLLDKTEYERFPQEDDVEIMFVDGNAIPADYLTDAKEVTIANITHFEWLDIVVQPEKRNKSGTLTQPRKSSNDEDFIFVNSPSIVSDASAGQQAAAMQQAIADTSELKPKTREDLTEAIDERAWTAYKILKKQGFYPRIYYGMVKVYPERVFWDETNDKYRIYKRKKRHNDPKEIPIEQVKMPL